MANLIALSQIKGGVPLRNDVNALQASYDAYKVLTDIAKNGGGNYNVNELLAALKATTDNLTADVLTAGSIDQRIKAAQDDLQGKINSINDMPIKDRVRIFGTVNAGTMTWAKDVDVTVPGIDKAVEVALYYGDNTPVQGANGENLTYNFGTGVISGVPSVVDATNVSGTTTYVPVAGPISVKAFPVGAFTFSQLPADYLLDNEELNLIAYTTAIDALVTDLSKDGDLIAKISALVGTEAVQDQIKLITDALAARVVTLEGKVAVLEGDETVAGSVKKAVKDEADARAAADTAEAQARTAADSAISDRIDALEIQVGGDVADQIAAEADARTAADTALQTNLGNLSATVASNKTDIEGKLADEVAARGVAEAAIIATELADRLAMEATVAANKTDIEGKLAQAQLDLAAADLANKNALEAALEAARRALVNADTDKQYAIDLINATTPVSDSVVTLAGQTVFNLSAVPNAEAVEIHVNGVFHKEGADLSVDRAAKTATWANTAANGGYDMAAGFAVELKYKTTATVPAPVYI